MDDLLTARQVQDMLKVDRITVYRMLNDGRLQGNKIGQQWRFSRIDVENLVNGLKVGNENLKDHDEPGLPVHCLQTIQDLLATVSQVSAVLVNEQGNSITEMSSYCDYCRQVCKQEVIKSACQASRREFVQKAQSGRKRFICHAGLHYTGTMVVSADTPVGLFLVGGFRRDDLDSGNVEALLSRLAEKTNLPLETLRSSFQKVPILTEEQESTLDVWTSATTQAFESILKERSAFARRLKKIADLTQIP